MEPLTIEKILEAEDRPVVEMPIPEWGGSIYVRALTAGQRDQLEEWESENGENIEGLRAKWAALGMCNPDGSPLTMTARQAMELSRKNGAVIDRIRLKLLELSRPQTDEELEGNSDAGPPAGSSAA